jgi:APA family basic amino acid/polyamine antiporter
MGELKRELGLLGATDIGIGAIIGAGIFVLSGIAAGLAGPSVILAFILAGVVALLSALSSAELSSFITEAGGSYIYTTRAFGNFWGFIVGWTAIYDYIVGASAVSIGFAAYLLYFVGLEPDQVLIVIIGTVLPIGLMLLNMKGLKEATRANNALVFMKVGALIVFVAVGIAFILGAPGPSNFTPFLPNGVSGLLSATAIVFFAFIGFNTVTTVSEEVKDPERTVPRAIMLAFGISTVLYIAVSAIEVGLVDWRVLGSSSAPLETALKVATDNILILEYVSISALFATASVVMSSIMGGSRALFAMARERTIPHLLARVSRGGIPTVAVLLCGLVIGGIVVFSGGNLEWLASAFNFGTLITFLFINLSVIQLRRMAPHQERHFRVPLYPATPLLAIASCAVLMLFLNLNAILIAVAWIGLGIGFYLVHQRRTGGLADKKEVKASPPPEIP